MVLSQLPLCSELWDLSFRQFQVVKKKSSYFSLSYNDLKAKISTTFNELMFLTSCLLLTCQFLAVLYILSLSFFKIPTRLFSYVWWENWREAVVCTWEVSIKNGSERDTALLSRLPAAKCSSVALAKFSRLVSSLAWCVGQCWPQLRAVRKPLPEQALRPKAVCSTLDSKFPYFFLVVVTIA